MTKFKDLKEGEKLSEVQFYSVVKIAGDKAQLLNERGENIVVDSKYVESCLTSASQFTETKKVSRTELADIVIKATNKAITLNFNKVIKEADVKAQIYELYPNKGGKILSEADFKKNVNSILKSALSGDERTMVGFHSGHYDGFGRVHFTDMEVVKDPSKSYDTRSRLFDPRSLNWAIVDGIKYVEK